ncbi:MAG: chemotaxis response regulator protein-glutamate methylesterase [Candidatus Kapabacteria bacterium]|nr:chemotaxis response regulator protein-glutamate methylesterase [Candidatus Kapabacteria bacterium]
MINKKIKVLIIDDSPIVREILKRGLSQDESIEIVGTAEDVYQARDMIVQLRPDVLTLDIEMPKMDGIEFLRRFMPQFPIPTIMVSSLTKRGSESTLKALENGTVDFVCKPSGNIKDLENVLMELRTKIKIASTINVSSFKILKNLDESRKTKSINQVSSNSHSDKIIAIGASTGGTEAIRSVIENLPSILPGIVIVQHMPKGFTKTFADRLNELSYYYVKEAEEGDEVKPGLALVAPGDFHLTLVKNNGKNIVKLSQSDKVNGHRPAVDPFFFSVADIYKEKALGIILTGMGNDGAQGLKKMLENGSYTIGQDEKSSIVYGMPKVAYEIGGVKIQCTLDKINDLIISKFQ